MGTYGRGQLHCVAQRTVNLGNYESIRVGLAESFDVGAFTMQGAQRMVLEKVAEWTRTLKPQPNASSQTQAGA